MRRWPRTSSRTTCSTRSWTRSPNRRWNLDPVALSPETALRRGELRVARRLDGLLQGERRGRRPGPGSDPSLTRSYEPGDDVRWLDWPLSARVGEPMVRVP